MPRLPLDLAGERRQLEGMNKYQALRAGPAYHRLAQADDIGARFRAKKIAARPTLVDEDRPAGDRMLRVRVEDLGDDRIRATVAVLHKWRKREFEQLGFIPAALQKVCERTAREVLEEHADLERAWVWGSAWCAEGTRRQLDLPLKKSDAAPHPTKGAQRGER